MKKILFLIPLLLLANVEISLAEQSSLPSPGADTTLSKELAQTFKEYDVNFKKVNRAYGPDCLEFYITPKQHPEWTHGNYMSRLYVDTLEANNDKPYSFIDERDNIRIDVAWADSKKELLYKKLEKIESPPMCAKK